MVETHGKGAGAQDDEIANSSSMQSKALLKYCFSGCLSGALVSSKVANLEAET